MNRFIYSCGELPAENSRRGSVGRIWTCVSVAGIVFGLIALIIWIYLPFYEKQLQARSLKNLEKIAFAMHDYNDEHGRLPPRVVYNRAGKPLYGWRVLLLPYLGPQEKELYRQFHLREAWDSPHNCQLLARMPAVYASPAAASDTDTHYLTFDGKNCAFQGSVDQGPLRVFNLVPLQFRGRVYEAGTETVIPRSFLAGTSQTILVIEADDAVPWTKPADIVYARKQPLPRLGGLYSGGQLNVAMVDGSTRSLQRDEASDANMRKAIAPPNDVFPEHRNW
jgi:hypothetical protein